MRPGTVSAVAICLLCAITAFGNPIIGEQVYIDFDPPNAVHSIYPEPFELVEAYVVVDLMMGFVPNFSAIYFRLDVTPGTADSPTFTNLIPGAIVEGDWFSGISITTECISGVPPVPIGKLSFTYNAIPGDVTIEPHPEFPALIINCAQEWYVFCVRMHGGVGKEALEGDCFASPVQDVSWGAVKGLYR